MASVAVVGGCGHVGLPLSIALARHHDVHIQDIDERAVALVRAGTVPFSEEGAEPELRAVLGKTLHVHTDPAKVSQCDYVVFIIGTPVDEHLNPSFTLFQKVFHQLKEHLRDGQTLVLRSTVYPGTTQLVERLLKESNLKVDVVFCPERVAEGFALKEIRNLPQIIAAFDARGFERARALFAPIGAELVELAPLEAELAKLFTNAWRYITFAAANQFYMLATDHGLDYRRILHAMKHQYPRTAGLPGPGFAAGPCLFKDTMQLASFGDNQFFLGHSAMLINEGMPKYLVNHLKKAHSPLHQKTVGILGMAFKANSDDIRESLSYKLKKILQVEAREVLTTDPHVLKDPSLKSLEDVIRKSDVLVMGVPHAEYRNLNTQGKPLFNIWG
jgi:UDP-N-acetyl-D-mannosaminuronic acid dehydrogenase